MHVRYRVPALIWLTLRVGLLAVLVFTVFRLLLLATEWPRIDGRVHMADIARALFMGLRFDAVITGYMLVLPFIWLTGYSFLDKKNGLPVLLARYFWLLLFATAFLVCAVDIPYFNHYFARLSMSVFEWVDSPVFVAKMVLEEPRYWLTALPFAALLWWFARRMQQYFAAFADSTDQMRALPRLGWSVLMLFVLFIVIRGRLEFKSPIRVGTAYFSNNAFLNQLGLNPNFTLMRSYLDSRKAENRSIRLMDDGEAIANVQRYLGISRPDPQSPFLRPAGSDSIAPMPFNVVLVIMESMSAAKMKRHGNPLELTPFLDSLSHCGYYFENAYTAGIHTFNGIFSSLFSYPALFRQHPMKESGKMYFGGIFETLRGRGYSTAYFTTHDGQFDNVEGFLRANGCEKVVTKSDYPAEKVKTTLGVPDDYMFEFAIPILGDLAGLQKPFFAAFMTASDHGPYYIPDYFQPKTQEVKTRIVEYADYSLRKFVDMASHRPWFEHTIFVFVADHGAALDGLYDMSLDYNHSPLLFYCPKIWKTPVADPRPAGQIDVGPTMLGALGGTFANNSLGINLFAENRPYIFFNGDDKYGVIDGEWFLVVRNDGSKSLYRYRQRETHNYLNEYVEVATRMDKYARSHLQAYQYFLLSKK